MHRFLGLPLPNSFKFNEGSLKRIYFIVTIFYAFFSSRIFYCQLWTSHSAFHLSKYKTTRTKDLPFLPHILPNLLEVAFSHIIKLFLCFVLKDHLWSYWKWLGVNDYWWSTSWVNETRVQKIQISRFFQSQSGSKLLITNPKLNI